MAKDNNTNVSSSNINNYIEFITIEKCKNRDKNILRDRQEEVKFPLSKEDKEIISLMEKRIIELGGVGLAAPQVNFHKKLAVIYIPEEAGSFRDNVIPYPVHTIINPSYEPTDYAQIVRDVESCYSVSSQAGEVPRFDSIIFRCQDKEGNWHETIESGFYARVIQHEVDHLNGTLIIDRFDEHCMTGTIKEMIQHRRNKLSPEQRLILDAMLKKKGISDIDLLD